MASEYCLPAHLRSVAAAVASPRSFSLKHLPVQLSFCPKAYAYGSERDGRRHVIYPVATVGAVACFLSFKICF